MIDNKLRDEISDLAREKGFHDNPIDQDEAHLWKQCAHMIIEIKEVCLCNFKSVSEEVADIAIVMLDLMGKIGVNVKPIIEISSATTWQEAIIDFIVSLGNLFDFYRKGTNEDEEYLWNSALSRLDTVAFFLNVDLEKSVREKHLKNKNRPKLYGVKS